MTTQLPDRARWYDAGNIADFHAALREDYPATARLTHGRPWLSKHFNDCDICTAIREDHQGAIDAERELAAAAFTSRRRVEIVVDLADMTDILGLDDDQEIIHMYCRPDGSAVHVVVMGSTFPVVPPGAPTPIADNTQPAGETSNVIPLRDAA